MFQLSKISGSIFSYDSFVQIVKNRWWKSGLGFFFSFHFCEIGGLPIILQEGLAKFGYRLLEGEFEIFRKIVNLYSGNKLEGIV